MNKAYGKDYFMAVIEREYGKRFAKDYDAIYTEIDLVKEEAKINFDTVSKQVAQEIVSLRRIISDRDLDI